MNNHQAPAHISTKNKKNDPIHILDQCYYPINIYRITLVTIIINLPLLSLITQLKGVIQHLTHQQKPLSVRFPTSLITPILLANQYIPTQPHLVGNQIIPFQHLYHPNTTVSPYISCSFQTQILENCSIRNPSSSSLPISP